jgi:pyrroloquinoline quinone biosynthesis protein D
MSDAAGAPRLAAGARLQTDRVTGGRVLLYPEGVLLLNRTAAAVLELCDGRRPVADVSAALAARFGATPEAVTADVSEFLGRLRERGLVRP